ncbi:MAG: type II secretion system protein J [Paracoccaceae bacterium]
MTAQRAAGFTLLEVLVAFVLVAIVLGAAYSGIAAGARGAARAEDTLAALAAAEATLARLGADVPLVPGETVLREDGWITRIAVAPYPERRAERFARQGAGLLSVEVVARHPSGAAVRLETLRLAP